MKKISVLVVGLVLSLMHCSDDDDGGGAAGGSPSAGTAGIPRGGAAGAPSSGAGGAPRGGAGGISGRIGLELCVLSVSCSNGQLNARYGHSCGTFTDTCELGCRTGQMGFPYTGDDVALARQYARQICEGEGGIGGQGGSGGEQGGSDGGPGGSDDAGSAGEDGARARRSDGGAGTSR